MIAYGCPKILMKLDFFGNAKIFDFLHFKKCEVKEKSLKLLQELNNENFLFALTMAGCEYLPNIERIGLKVALKHFSKHESFGGVMKFLRENKATKEKVPKDYEIKADKVVELLRYQTVFDLRTQ